MVEKRGENDNYLRFVHKNNSKYNLEILSEDSDDFQLIKKSFNNTSSRTKIHSSYNFKIERICRVHQKYPSRKPEDMVGKSVLVFHGTSDKNVPSILRNGFRSSEMGCRGPGVYHSNYFSACLPYADNNDGSYTLFINEIPTEYLTKKYEYDYKAVLPEFYCHKYLCSPEVREEYARDSNGSFINIIDDKNIGAMYPYFEYSNDVEPKIIPYRYYTPEYVASSNIVIPKYLVHVENVMEKLVEKYSILLLYLMFKLK